MPEGLQTNDQRMTEFGQTRPVFMEFEHRGQKFWVGKRDIKYNEEVPENERFEDLGIFNQENKYVGYISGQFFSTPKGLEFHVGNFNNSYVGNYKHHSSLHVPGLVRETIAQLLVQHKIDVYSITSTLLDGGIKLNEALLNDPRLVHIPSQPTPGAKAGYYPWSFLAK